MAGTDLQVRTLRARTQSATADPQAGTAPAPCGGVTVVTSPTPAATAALAAAALGGPVVLGGPAARDAIAEALRRHRVARIRLLGAAALARHAAAAVPDAVVRVPADVVRRAAANVAETERTAAEAALSLGPPPDYDPLLGATARFAAATAAAADARARRARAHALGRDLVAANGCGLAALVAGAAFAGTGHPLASPVVAACVGTAVAAWLLAAARVVWRVTRTRAAAERRGAIARAALTRAGASSLADLDALDAAYHHWHERRLRAAAVAAERDRLRSTWHQLVGDACPDDAPALVAAARRRLLAETAHAEARSAAAPGAPLVVAVDPATAAEIAASPPGPPVVVVVPA